MYRARADRADVLHRRLCVAADHAGEPGDPLGADRVSLVRRSPRSPSYGPREQLFDLAHLGLLEVADLGREALQAENRGERDRLRAGRRGGRAPDDLVETTSSRPRPS